MTPAVFLPRLLGCFLTGALLGPGMDLLRPIHRRLPRLTELLLCGLLLTAWLFASFGLCRGDLQLGYDLAMGLGFALWEWLFGRAVSAFFARLWHFAGIPLREIRKFFQKKRKFPLFKMEKMEYNR